MQNRIESAALLLLCVLAITLAICKSRSEYLALEKWYELRTLKDNDQRINQQILNSLKGHVKTQ